MMCCELDLSLGVEGTYPMSGPLLQSPLSALARLTAALPACVSSSALSSPQGPKSSELASILRDPILSLACVRHKRLAKAVIRNCRPIVRGSVNYIIFFVDVFSVFIKG